MVDAALVSIEQNNTGKVLFEKFSGWLVAYKQGNVIPYKYPVVIFTFKLC